MARIRSYSSACRVSGITRTTRNGTLARASSPAAEPAAGPADPAAAGAGPAGGAAGSSARASGANRARARAPATRRMGPDACKPRSDGGAREQIARPEEPSRCAGKPLAFSPLVAAIGRRRAGPVAIHSHRGRAVSDTADLADLRRERIALDRAPTRGGSLRAARRDEGAAGHPRTHSARRAPPALPAGADCERMGGGSRPARGRVGAAPLARPVASAGRAGDRQRRGGRRSARRVSADRRAPCPRPG